MGISALILLLVFAVLLVVGIPVAFCLGLSTFGSLLMSTDFNIATSTVAQRVATGLDSFTLLAIPFFILAGQIMGQGGLARRLIAFARAIVGALPGGLAFVNIASNMLFGAVSGSAIASASAIGSIMHPRMTKSGYSPSYSAAVNVTSATTGLMIPPSNVLIVYSLASGGVSIAALFVAGYLPGILTGLLLMGVAGVMAHRKGYGTGERASLREVGRRFVDALLSLTLIVIVIGGIVGGVFTATEAAAIAVVYALILAVGVYREMGLKELPGVLLSAIMTTAVVMFLIGTSMALSWLLAYLSIPQAVGAALVSASSNGVVILLLINLLLLVVGTFMDMTPAILIFTPIFLPTAVTLGIDPLHFGILMVLNLCIGLCTPPVGTVLFAGLGVANVSMSEVVRPLLPLYVAMIIALGLITYIPDITMILPRLFGLL